MPLDDIKNIEINIKGAEMRSFVSEDLSKDSRENFIAASAQAASANAQIVGLQQFINQQRLEMSDDILEGISTKHVQELEKIDTKLNELSTGAGANENASQENQNLAEEREGLLAAREALLHAFDVDIASAIQQRASIEAQVAQAEAELQLAGTIAEQAEIEASQSEENTRLHMDDSRENNSEAEGLKGDLLEEQFKTNDLGQE